jgi:hypothetical protein
MSRGISSEAFFHTPLHTIATCSDATQYIARVLEYSTPQFHDSTMHFPDNVCRRNTAERKLINWLLCLVHALPAEPNNGFGCS